MKKIGTTVISKITGQADMDKFVKSLDIKSDKVIIKPNWIDADFGSHTEALALDMLLNSLKRPAIIVESYTFWRTERMFTSGEDYFSSKEATVETGKIHWQHFKDQDKWFLQHEGFDKILEEHGAEYINITDKVWEGDVADRNIIKKIVEDKYPPVNSPELYSRIPKKLYELRGSDFISFSKAKGDSDYGASLSIKNIFGLIPDPHRSIYHRSVPGGPEDKLADSIIDINKIYQSLFNPVFVVDGTKNVIFKNWDTNKTELLDKNWGIIAGCHNGLEVDSIILKLMNNSFKGVLADAAKTYEKVFGGFDIAVTENDISDFEMKNEATGNITR